jgi:hypothetical protein
MKVIFTATVKIKDTSLKMTKSDFSVTVMRTSKSVKN